MRVCLVLLLSTLAWASPNWQALTPVGEKFSCRFPPGRVKEFKSSAAHKWLLLEKSKYALQVVSIEQAGPSSRVEFYLSKVIETSQIKESLRKPIQQGGLSGLEIRGSMPSSPKGRLAVHMRVLASPDHLYHLAAYVPSGGNARVIDPFFKSFKLK